MNFSALQRKYDNQRARDCEEQFDSGIITSCPECGRRVYNNPLTKKVHCEDIEYCAWSEEL